MPHKDNTHHHLSWPQLEEGYEDEFGYIDPDVYRFAADVWPLAQSPAFQNVIDTERLLIKAVALVSRICAEQPAKIGNLKAYLYKTFFRLLLEQLKKQQRLDQFDTAVVDHVEAGTTKPEDEIARIILIHEILRRADGWTKNIFSALVQGYTLEELAEIHHTKANVMRSKLSKNITRIRKQLDKETRAAEQRILRRSRVSVVDRSENK